ncbi:hypothetical protein BHE74_00057859, partial [Ensete ventricosum]
RCYPPLGFCGTGGPTITHQRFTHRILRKSGSRHFSNFGLTFTLTSLWSTD